MMENDIINIVKALYNGEDNIYGNLTTSINNTNLSVCLSYMPIDRVGDAKYEIIASTSVHPSFLYIAKVLNIKVLRNDDRNEISVTVKFKIISTNESLTTQISLTRLR